MHACMHACLIKGISLIKGINPFLSPITNYQKKPKFINQTCKYAVLFSKISHTLSK